MTRDTQGREVTVIPILIGTFYCDECGRSWVGRWHGPREEIICRWCRAPLEDVRTGAR